MMADPLTSPPPNKRKRLLPQDDEQQQQSMTASSNRHRSSSSAAAMMSTTNTKLLIEQQKIETLQAELQHERSLRSFDQQRNQQQQERLSQQVALALEEAAGAKKLLDQWRTSHNSMADSLRQSRDALQEKVQDLQLQVEELQGAAAEHEADVDQVSRAAAECRQLQQQLQTSRQHESELRDELQQVQRAVSQQQQAAATSSTAEPSGELTKLLEEAPPAVMKELHRVRLNLAETQRRERQLNRRVQTQERRNQTLISEREQALVQGQRLPVVQAQLEQVQAKHEQLAAENATFKDFCKRLATQLRALNITVQHSDGPPEVSTLFRFLDTAQKQVDQAKQQAAEYKDQCTTLQTTVQTQQERITVAESKEQELTAQRDDLTQKLQSAQRQVELLQGQQGIYAREADSLRTLIKTFDELPLAPRGRKGGASGSAATEDATAQALQISLSSVRKELELVQKDRDRCTKELDAANQTQKERTAELDRVKTKFRKLRDALEAERANVASAEARANSAEVLAGKGSFDPNSTRVLHLKETPLTHALREEVKVLKKQLEVAKSSISGSGSGERSSSSSKLAPDPDKLNQRLKQNFKEQIAVFREGVYLMTGYKVDMLPSSTDNRPTFRVRSMFAEKEEDHLMLKWPAARGESGGATSLDILNSDFAKLLATTPSYDYMTKFHSLPAFLSSVQLSLFEKQTVMMI